MFDPSDTSEFPVLEDLAVEENSGEESETFIEVKKTDLGEMTDIQTSTNDTSGIPGNVCDESAINDKIIETEYYHGVKIKPLSSFGTFEITTGDIDSKWFGDATSGEVHRDMPTISMLYHQRLVLPEGAEEFIAQSPKLEEEARWEKSKAVFYNSQPKEVFFRAISFLKELSTLEARRVIAMKTARFNTEAILKPMSPGLCNTETAANLAKEIPVMINLITKLISEFCPRLKSSKEELTKISSYGDSTRNLGWHECSEKSKIWKEKITFYRELTKKSIQARLVLYQLQHANVRYEPYTEWVHVKTSFLSPGEEKNGMLYNELFQLLAPEEFQSTLVPQKKNKAVNYQVEIFEYGLQKYGDGLFKKFDSLYNNDQFEPFEFLMPYEDVSPALCVQILQDEFRIHDWNVVWKIVSEPLISGYPKLFHQFPVYLEKNEKNIGCELRCNFETILKRKNKFEACFNCFEKGHNEGLCRREGFVLQDFV